MHPARLPAFLVAAWREMHAAFPAECCGLLWGSPRGVAPCDVSEIPGQALDLPEAILCIEPLPNLRPRSDRFEIDPLAAARAERRARRAGFRLLGYYHAHPDGAVSPSELDRIGECWPGFGPRLRLIVAPPRRWALYRIDRREWTFVAGKRGFACAACARGGRSETRSGKQDCGT